MELQMLIQNECTEEELFTYIKSNPIYIMLTNDAESLFKYIVVNEHMNICDYLIILNKKYHMRIIFSICKYTENIKLYDKYNNNYVVFNFCFALLYNNDPSLLSDHILLTNDISLHSENSNCFFLIFFESVCMCTMFNEILPKDEMWRKNTESYFTTFNQIIDFDTRFKLIMYTIDEFKLFMRRPKKYYELFRLLPEDYAIKIIENLLNNNIHYDVIDECTWIIITNCSLSNIKLFIEKYQFNHEYAYYQMHLVKDYDIFLYLINLIGDVSEIHFRTFDYDIPNNYKIIEWLCKNISTFEPIIYKIKDFDAVLLIVQYAAINNNLNYIYNNTDGIINFVKNDKFMEIFGIISVNILDINKIINNKMIYANQDFIDMLVEHNILTLSKKFENLIIT